MTSYMDHKSGFCNGSHDIELLLFLEVSLLF